MKTYGILCNKESNLIKRIISVILACSLLITLSGCGSDDNNGEGTSKAAEINNNLENYGRWANVSLGVSYLLPKTLKETKLDISHSFSYLHGCSHHLLYNYNTYVEKSLEGYTDLNTLFSAIVNEKLNSKYSYLYAFDRQISSPAIEKNENIKVGNIDTVYFETVYILSDTDKKELYRYIGYSFVYNDEYICVYAEAPKANGEQMVDGVLENQEYYDNAVNERLLYIINSFEDYSDESFYDLDNNFNAKYLYDDGYVSTDNKFVINNYSQSAKNGVFRIDGYYYGLCLDNKTTDTDDIPQWDGKLESIFDLTVNPMFRTDNNGSVQPILYDFKFGWTDWQKTDENKEKLTESDWKNNGKYDIVKANDYEINSIKMKKYVLNVKNSETDKTQGIYVVYTFIYNDMPYLVQYKLNDDLYNNQEHDLSDDQIEMITKQTEIVGDTLIRTIRIIGADEKWSDFVTIN